MTAHSDRVETAADLIESAGIRLESWSESASGPARDLTLAQEQTNQAGAILLLAIAQSLAGIHNEMQTARRKR